MNNIIKKTVGKVTLLSVISAVVLVVAVAVLAIFGFNRETTIDDANTLTVNVNQYAYTEYFDEIENICNDVFEELDLSYVYDMKGEMIGDESEILYVFKKDVNLDKAVDKLNTAFATATADEGVLSGALVRVTTNSEISLDKLPQYALLRAAIGGSVFAIVVGLYLAVRQNLLSGLTAGVSMTVSMALTCALVLIVRVPLSGSILYAFVFNMLFTAIATVFTLNKFTAKSKENADIDAEELVCENVAVKETVTFGSAMAVALILIGAIATSGVRYFAIMSFLALVAGMFEALIFAPAFYLPLKRYADKKQAQRSRYDYKKGVSETKN